MILRERSFHICLNTRRDFSRPLSTKISSFLEINLTIFSEISSFQGGWFLFEDHKKSFNIMIAIKMFRFEAWKFGCESSSSLFYSDSSYKTTSHFSAVSMYCFQEEWCGLITYNYCTIISKSKQCYFEFPKFFLMITVTLFSIFLAISSKNFQLEMF